MLLVLDSSAYVNDSAMPAVGVSGSQTVVAVGVVVVVHCMFMY